MWKMQHVESFVKLGEIDIPQKTQRKKTQRKFMWKMQYVESFVKLCDSFVELGEIDIPQKTQRKKHKKHKEN